LTGERGSVTIVAAALIGLLAVLTAGLGGLAQVVAARDQAQMAADAAALAAAPVTFRPFGAKGSAHGEAGRFAEANGASLVRCTGCEPDASWQSRIVEVVVSVEVDVLGLGVSSVSATSAAEFNPILLLDAS
jgi:secretion/DNA translocation related TadE-like protein